MNKRVTLYVKPGCHLCEDVERQVCEAQSRVGFDIERVNIMSDPVLELRYGFDIPVVAIDGVVFSTHFVDAEKFERRLKEI